jgi:Caspase domain
MRGTCAAPQTVDGLQGLVMKRLRSIAAVLLGGGLMLVISGSVVLADKRVALVIGNSSYQNAARLPNPARDADAVADMFKRAGYEVSLLKDAGNLEFKRNIRKFEDTASDADVAVVFYAGHGIEIGGTNYAIPVDAKLASDRDAPDEAIELTRIIQTVDGAKRLRLVILDACRDNPFLARMKRQRHALRQVAAGLGPVGDVSSETLVAYAAKQGLTAEDGNGDHSPFTTAILHNLPEPGLDIRLAFGRVRDEVLKITSNRQEPYVYGSLGGSNVALVLTPEKAAPQIVDQDKMRADYELVMKVFEKVGKTPLKMFLEQYPSGLYSELVREQLNQLETQEKVALATGPSPAQSPVSDPKNQQLAAIPQREPPAPAQASPDSQAWEDVRDTTDPDGDRWPRREGAGRCRRSARRLGPRQGLQRPGRVARLHQPVSGLAVLDPRRQGAHRSARAAGEGAGGQGPRRDRRPRGQGKGRGRDVASLGRHQGLPRPLRVPRVHQALSEFTLHHRCQAGHRGARAEARIDGEARG